MQQQFVLQTPPPAPSAPVHDGKCLFGVYSSPFRNINLLDAQQPMGFWLPRFLLRNRLKEWQALQFGNQRWFALVAVYNAKMFGLAQLVLFDRENNKRLFYEKRVLPTMLTIPQSLYNTKAEYRSKNFHLCIHNHLEKNEISFEFDIKKQSNLPPLSGALKAQHVGEPLVVCLPLGTNRPFYSHKALMPMEGNMLLGNDSFGFDKKSSFMISDDHKAFYPNPLQYDWVTGAGFDANGQLAGFNLTANQAIDPDVYNENCLWYAGRVYRLPRITFRRGSDIMQPWVIEDSQKLVQITFTPLLNTAIYNNFLVIQSRYDGPYGTIEGYITMPDGKKMDIGFMAGMGERKFIRA